METVEGNGGETVEVIQEVVKPLISDYSQTGIMELAKQGVEVKTIAKGFGLPLPSITDIMAMSDSEIIKSIPTLTAGKARIARLSDQILVQRLSSSPDDESTQTIAAISHSSTRSLIDLSNMPSPQEPIQWASSLGSSGFTVKPVSDDADADAGNDSKAVKPS